MTSKFSGSFQSANNAKQILLENYPNRRIEVLDSICVTGTQGLLVWEACRMQNAGYDMDKLIDTLNQQKQTTKINFTVENLDFLQHGGRVGKAAAFAGAILNIKPVIVMKQGELFPESKVRGHKKALKTILDMTKQEIGNQKHCYHLCVIRGEKEKARRRRNAYFGIATRRLLCRAKPLAYWDYHWYTCRTNCCWYLLHKIL